uniref:Uncharacterized protein n=1 Tax=Mycena chlorophos TaxID=658473 RepID=A0ABQ0L4W9_MYCCL|nr:predicted protein [Mycena chlorophos]
MLHALFALVRRLFGQTGLFILRLLSRLFVIRRRAYNRDERRATGHQCDQQLEEAPLNSQLPVRTTTSCSEQPFASNLATALSTDHPKICSLDAEVSPLPALLNDAHARIFPGSPETLGRYSRRIFASDERTRFKVPPLTISSEIQNPDEEWKLCLHSEGTPYFFHAGNRVYTDANLFNPALRLWVNEQMRTILDFLQAHDVTLNTNVDLVLDEYIYTDKSQGCQYYFVNHDSQRLFWIDFAVSKIFEEAEELPNGVTSTAHVGLVLEERYWYHCVLFPHSLVVTKDIVDELRVSVLYAIAGTMTSATSTVSRRVGELHQMVKVIDGVSKNFGSTRDRILSGMSSIVARFMYEFAHNRVLNFYGQPSVRVNVYSSIYSTKSKRTLLIRILSPMLFYAPDFHLKGLHKIYTDGLVRHSGWSDFVNRLTSEWQEFTLYATVVLNANVAFLSIQTVDTNGQQTPRRSPTQIVSYMSMLTSIGAIIVGLLLLRQNRNRDRGTAAEASRYMFDRTHPTLGLETLAILHSLPYAMLIWSMVSFLIAFLFMCLQDADIQTRVVVAIMSGTVLALILWCVVEGWENGMLPSRSIWSWPWAEQENNQAEKGDGEKGDQVVEQELGVDESKPEKQPWRCMSFSLRKGLNRTAAV